MPDDHHDDSPSNHIDDDAPAETTPAGDDAPDADESDPTPPPMLGRKPIANPARRNIKHHEGSIKETIISMMISLAMALVAKAYVIEAFVIPTGSMAPTLLGKHMLFDSRQTGYDWTVNPWFDDSNRNPFPVQEYQGVFPVVTDPMTVSCVQFDPDAARRSRTLQDALHYDQGFEPVATPKRILPGDRILVHKYLYEIFPPHRYDVVVFKNPEDATINFIKRLIGLPNEQIWIVDGDVFARSYTVGADGSPDIGTWQVQRKPPRVQRSVWRTIYSSEYAPLKPLNPAGPWSGRNWSTKDLRIYRTDTADPTRLRWDLEHWPLTDWEPYNDVRTTTSLRLQGGQQLQFPIADLRMRAIVTPDNDDLRLVAVIRAREHEYQAEISNDAVVVRMRDGNGPWQELDSTKAPPALKSIKPFKAGTPRTIEFCHVDQSLQVWIDGKKIVEGFYDWDPNMRILYSTGLDVEYFKGNNNLGHPNSYKNAEPTLVEWTFENSPATLSRVGLDRDLYYQPRNYPRFSGEGGPAFGTHPQNLVTLDSDEFFMLGDNSPSSADGRLWETIDPNVGVQIDDKKGVVNRKLLLGKAFFVYFPAPHTLDVAGLHIPIPDFGNMRFIK